MYCKGIDVPGFCRSVLFPLCLLGLAAVARGDEIIPLGLKLIPNRVSHLPPDQQSLVSEYPEQFDRVAEFYENISLEGQVAYERRISIDEDWSLSSQSKGVVKHHGWNSFRVDSGSVSEGRFMLIANPLEWHAFVASPNSDQFIVRAHGRMNRELIDTYGATYGFFISSPFSSPLRVATCKSEAKWKLHRLDLGTSPDGEETVQATFSTPIAEPYRQLCVSRFLKKRQWVVTDLIHVTADPKLKVYTVSRTMSQYGEDLSGIPLIREVCRYDNYSVPFQEGATNPMERFEPVTEEPLSLRRERVVIERVIPGIPDKSEFDAKPYLQKLGELGQISKSNVRMWLIFVNGFLFLFFGLYLYRREQKKTTDPTSTNEISTPDATSV